MSEAAKRAAELIEQAWTEFDSGAAQTEQLAFEQYIQHVSDVAKLADSVLHANNISHVAVVRKDLRALILPDEPDPLVEALKDIWGGINNDDRAARVRTALKARGLQITPIGDGV